MRSPLNVPSAQAGWQSHPSTMSPGGGRKDFTLAPCSVLVLLTQVCCVLSLLSLKHLSCQLLGRELCAVLGAWVCQPYVLHVGCANSVDVFCPKCSIQEPCTSLDSLPASHALWHKITVSTSSREMETENQRHMSNIPQTASAAANVSQRE